MSNLSRLNRTILRLEKAGHIKEDEYATYKDLLEAVETLKDCQNTMQNMSLQIEQMRGMFDDEDDTIQAALEDYADTEMRARYSLEKLK